MDLNKNIGEIMKVFYLFFLLIFLGVFFCEPHFEEEGYYNEEKEGSLYKEESNAFQKVESIEENNMDNQGENSNFHFIILPCEGEKRESSSLCVFGVIKHKKSHGDPQPWKPSDKK